MSIQLSTPVRNAELDQIEATIGTSAVLQIRSGAPPSNCAAGNTGTLLATLSLPSDWMANASGGSKSLAGTWSGSGGAAGTAGHFRIFDSSATTCGIQGTVTATGGGGDMTLDNTNIANAQSISITSFTLTAGNP